jgi:hypothetical protein
MERVVRQDVFARCPFSAAIERSEVFLRGAAERERIDELVVASAVNVVVVEDSPIASGATTHWSSGGGLDRVLSPSAMRS